MWVLDPGNSPELLARLKPHALADSFELVWCGEGWKHLVSSCHDELVAAVPDTAFTPSSRSPECLHIRRSPGQLAPVRGTLLTRSPSGTPQSPL